MVMDHNLNDKSQDGTDTGEARRAALKRFGRYAAAAPAAMVLLDAHDSHAGGSKSRGRGSKGRRRGGYH